MKTVTGRVISAEPISLSKATKLLSGFASSDNCASQAVSAYLRRASAAFTELKNTHREIISKDTKPISDSRPQPNPTGEFDGGKISYRESETVSEKEAIYGMEQDVIKEDKKKKKKKKKKSKKSKKNKEEDVIEEKMKEKLEEEQKIEERKERKKEKKKKRKSHEEMGSEERKSKKKKKSKEIDG